MISPKTTARLLQSDDFIFEHHRESGITLLPQSFFMHSISIQLGGPSKVEVWCGEKRNRVTLHRGDVTIAPYRFAIDGAHVEACEFLQLHLKPAVVDRAANLGRPAIIAPILAAVDPLAEQTIYQLEEEITSGRGTRGYVDLLIENLATHLAKHYSADAWSGDVGALPKYLLERTLEFINGGLDRNLSIEEIANAVGIEPERFVRAFKASTGKSVDRYIHSLRVEP